LRACLIGVKSKLIFLTSGTLIPIKVHFLPSFFTCMVGGLGVVKGVVFLAFGLIVGILELILSNFGLAVVGTSELNIGILGLCEGKYSSLERVGSTE